MYVWGVVLGSMMYNVESWGSVKDAGHDIRMRRPKATPLKATRDPHRP